MGSRAEWTLSLLMVVVLTATLHMPMVYSRERAYPMPTSSPIVIDGDQDLEDMASDLGWPGDGSKGSPFLIEGLSIDALGKGACIYLGNTSLHVEVRNCTTTGTLPASSYKPGAGIVLWDCRNVTVRNCTAIGNLFGIYSLASSMCAVRNCTLRSSRNDVVLIFSDDNMVEGNDLKGSAEGLMLQSSNRNTIRSNSLSFSTTLSMGVFESKGNTVSENLFHNNTGEAYLYLSEHNNITENEFRDNDIALKVSWSPYNRMDDNLYRGNDLALYMVSSRHNNITDQTMSLNDKGIHLYHSDYNDISLGWIEGSETGVHIEHSQNNAVSDLVLSDIGTGVLVEGDSDGNSIMSCILAGAEGNTDRGIWISTSDGWNNLLRLNTVINCLAGIHISNTDMTWVDRNVIRACTEGILVTDTVRGNVTGNMVSDCTTGIECGWSDTLYHDELTIEGNLIKDCSNHGILADLGPETGTDLRKLVISGNRIDGCGIAVDVLGSSNDLIEGNHLWSNEVGIMLVGGHDDLIYNNYLNNAKNVVLENSSGTAWNITRTPGTNIVFGPYLGGNHWSDYNGSDLDGDGLGDEFVPFGPGDHHPLVRDTSTPIVTDLTNGTPETGRAFRMIATLEDRPEPQELDVVLDYEVMGTDGSVVDQGRSAQKHWKETTYSLVITVPINGVLLRYRFIATDRAGNSEGTYNEVTVRDVISPVVTLSAEGLAETGGLLEVNLTVTENIMMGSVLVQYSVSEGAEPYGNISLDLGGRTGISYLRPEIPLLSNSTSVLITAAGSDMAGNGIEEVVLKVNVTDIIPPEIIDTDLDILDDGLGVSAVITDNVGVSGGELHVIWSAARTVRTPLAGSGVQWSAKVPIPLDAVHFRWELKAWDLQVNIVEDEGSMDIVPPSLSAISDLTRGSPMTGREFLLAFEERPGLSPVQRTVEWWFETGDLFSVEGSNATISVPDNAMYLHYRFTVRDSYGAEAAAEGEREVLDIIPPSIDLFPGQAVNGRTMTLTWSVIDNIAVKESHIALRFDGGEWEVLVTEGHLTSVDVPRNVSVLELEGHVTDDSLIDNKSYLHIDVLDPIPPGISVFEGRFDELNDTFVISARFDDNRGSGMAKVRWAMGGLDKGELDLDDAWGSLHSIVLDLNGFEGELEFTVALDDPAGNRAEPTRFHYVIDRDDVADGFDLGLLIIIALVIAIIAVLLMALYLWTRKGNAPASEE